MRIEMPTDCGNSPRIQIVGDVATAWASGDSTVLAQWLAEEATWTVVGGHTHRGPEAAGEVRPPFPPEYLELRSIVTHGRLASCDGYLEADGRRLSFSHVLRFASTAKTAKIAEVRSYMIEA